MATVVEVVLEAEELLVITAVSLAEVLIRSALTIARPAALERPTLVAAVLADPPTATARSPFVAPFV